MKYITLLRGINVGGNRKVEMKKLKVLFESFGCTNVVTYLNSGNVIFESELTQESLQILIPNELSNTFKFSIPTIIKSAGELKKITAAIPREWKNDSAHKTDVAFLFPEIDSKNLINELPIIPEFIEVIYVKGAIIWHLDKKNYNKSHLNKIINLKQYQLMTVRNVNTARFLAK